MNIQYFWQRNHQLYGHTRYIYGSSQPFLFGLLRLSLLLTIQFWTRRKVLFCSHRKMANELHLRSERCHSDSATNKDQSQRSPTQIQVANTVTLYASSSSTLATIWSPSLVIPATKWYPPHLPLLPNGIFLNHPCYHMVIPATIWSPLLPNGIFLNHPCYQKVTPTTKWSLPHPPLLPYGLLRWSPLLPDGILLIHPCNQTVTPATIRFHHLPLLPIGHPCYHMVTSEVVPPDKARDHF